MPTPHTGTALSRSHFYSTRFYCTNHPDLNRNFNSNLHYRTADRPRPLPPTAASADPIDPNAEINADPTSDPTSTGPSAANANAVCRNNVCNSKHDA